MSDIGQSMSAYQRPVDAAALAQNFRVFANAECASEPLHDALSRAIAGAIDDRFGGTARPVVFHSWVVSYFDREARLRFAEAVRAFVIERDGGWISAEAAGAVACRRRQPRAPRGHAVTHHDTQRTRRVRSAHDGADASALPRDRVASLRTSVVILNAVRNFVFFAPCIRDSSRCPE